MPLRKEHENFIRTEVEKQIGEVVNSFRPHGWRKLLYTVQQWGGVAAVITVFLTLLTLVAIEYHAATARVKEEAEFRTHTNDRLDSIESGIKDIRSRLDAVSLSQLSSGPLTDRAIAQAKTILAQAASSGVKIDKAVIGEAGVKFISAAHENPAAWNAAIEFLNYKSFLDFSSVPTPFPVLTTTEQNHVYYKVTAPPGESVPSVKVPREQGVPKEKAARLNMIGEDLNKSLSTGNSHITLEGGAIVIDDMDMKNVVLKNVHVVYHGGPVIMENVFFSNCTFTVSQEPNSQNFAEVFLKSGAAINFRTA